MYKGPSIAAEDELDNDTKLPILTFSRWKPELKLLWNHKILLGLCIIIQYLHGVATNIAYYRHDPNDRLKDIGYQWIAELPQKWKFLSELPLSILFLSNVALILLSLFHKMPRAYMMIILIRIAVASSICVMLRSITFLSTSLPSPADHCLPGSSNYHPPTGIIDILFRIDGFDGCGDLLYSGHTSLSLILLISFMIYGRLLLPPSMYRVLCFAVLLPTFMALPPLIIAARKHYTVDVIVALYVTPMFYYTSYYIFPDPNLKTKDKDRSIEMDVEIDPSDFYRSF